MIMTIRFRLFKSLYIYLTTSPMRIRRRRKVDMSREYRREYHANVLNLIRKRSGCKCEICGQGGVMLHIHHILPYSRFPEMDNNMDNLLYICHTCHNNIHINPFVNIRLMKQVADRYGIDLVAKFDETDKSNKV